MGELVSVIIPTYNRESTIEKAVRSVLDQSYSSIEVIIVDDCSADNTENVIKTINDIRLQYYRLDKNSGACVARNYGVTKAKGDIIAFQDSDDVWDKEKLVSEVAYLLENDLEFISCGFRRIYENGKIKELGRASCSINNINNWCMLLDNNWVSTQTIICKKYCFDKIQFDKKLRRYQDWDLAIQASLIFKMGSLNESLVNVYLQGDSITRTVNSYESKLAVIKKHEADIVDGNRQMIAQYYKSLAGVQRWKDTKLAAKHYWKSFINKPDIRVFVLWIMTTTGLVKIRDRNRNITY